MRPITTIPLLAILACGPLSPQETTTSASSETSDTTTTPPPATTSSSEPPTTTLDSTTLDSTTTTEAVPFIIKPDGPVDDFQCDPFKQDCKTGQKCTAWAEGGSNAWNATKCVDITGDGAPGDPCTTVGGGVSGHDDCGLGAMCWDVNVENQGTCIGLCTGSPDDPKCPLGFSCSVNGDGVLNLCIPDCDPLLQDCPGDNLCISTGDHFFCVLDASGDTGATNDPCEFANACDKGLVCLNTANASAACQQGSQGCCQPFCKFPNSPCPNPDQQCLSWFGPGDEILPGSEDVGICSIPQ